MTKYYNNNIVMIYSDNIGLINEINVKKTC